MILKGEVKGRRCVATGGGGGRLQFSVREVFNWGVTLEDRLISASPSITRGQETPGVTWSTPRSHGQPRNLTTRPPIMSPPPFHEDVTTSTHLGALLSAPPVTRSLMGLFVHTLTRKTVILHSSLEQR